MDSVTRPIPIKLRDGTTINIEATMIGRQDVALVKAGYSFEDITKTIEGVAKEIQETIKRVAPKKATVKFGVEVSAESGQLTALLVKGSGKANLEISLEWSS